MPLRRFRLHRFWYRPLCALLLTAVAGAGRAECTVSASGLNLGGYDPFASAPLEGVGSIDVRCAENTAYSIALSAGGAGTYGDRYLIGGNGRLSYNLYTDVSRTTVWGDGSAGTATVAGSTSGGRSSHSIYGLVRPRQNVPAGTYQDSIVVTVTY